MCTDARKREKERTVTERREDRGSRKSGRKEERRGGSRNEILANAFVFATRLHRDDGSDRHSADVTDITMVYVHAAART